MKKTLIALAVLGASGVALAESSVTLYGVADAGVGRIKTQSDVDPRPPVFADPGDAENGNGKAQFTSHSLMNNGNSRFGLKGVEDLGGGNSVGFQFESGLDLDDGAADGTFWQRQANVWIGGGWGTFKMGRQFVPSFLAQASYELTDMANYGVLPNTYGVTSMFFRAPSALAYVTPNMGGLQAAVAFVSKNDTGLAKNIWDLGVTYANGPIAAGLSVNKGYDDGKTNYQLGAKYKFSNFAVAASYHNSTSDGVNVPHGMDVLGREVERRRRGFGIGASANMGAFTVTVDVTRDTKNDFHGKKFTNGLLEAKYALSKRTFLYGAALRLDGQTNYGVGINHSF